MKITALSWGPFSEDLFDRCDRGLIPMSQADDYLSWGFGVLAELEQLGRVEAAHPIELPLRFVAAYRDFYAKRYELTIQDVNLQMEQLLDPPEYRPPEPAVVFET